MPQAFGIISFDCVFDENEHATCFEGCYRVPPSEWKVFWFTNAAHGGRHFVKKDAIFGSGILGVCAEFADERPLSKALVKQEMSKLLKIQHWQEVRGPDSLWLK